MNNEVKLSNKGKAFLENLRVYLFSSGRNSDEIEEIVEELEAHLYDAEKNGKPIEKIIGKSPKEYMEMVSNEMAVDYRSWITYVCLIVFGSFSITIFPDLLKGQLSYSVLEIVGHIVICAIFIASVLIGFKYISTSYHSIKKQGLIVIMITILPIALFIGLIFLNEAVVTPAIDFSGTASMIIGIITALVIIGISIWAKTWILIVIIALLTLPEYLLSLTSLTYEIQLILSPWITFAGIAIYLWISYKREKNEAM
ncbi:HAAS domain-containing protein [Virgibacillus oceani]|uniref:HAAS transmembrane region domain-containing protein n=1 Tax=Virgibacillus oceani TaxID=1479511 RepID=A0A917H9N9_9BACI|nr:hypothetical protein [Virgibacillus oceani]GGG72142.1 hypothetical protein GCM10011398_15610 [Virgibacillus oceani]